MENKELHTPEILAPAGNRASFFAAVEAGADAVYCGLKNFSARMEADNFSIEELAILRVFAHSKNVRVYVAINSILKPDDLEKAASQLDKLKRYVKPDALILSDLALIKIVRHIGFKGELHLSTLANMSHPSGISFAKQLGVSRIVIPRELNIDEIKTMAENCSEGIELEAFIHGALCYAISGRCYWSSYLGGKSGLRGRCVQPCRRIYSYKSGKKRYFSCQDLSLDVLVKVLRTLPEISTWKIEGRKKGPHYVYYTVKAYKILRDHGHDPQQKKIALGLLGQALGRPATHYAFLPQRPQNPIDTSKQTGSGLLIGALKGSHKNQYFIPRQELYSGDLLRIGYEDTGGHTIQRVYKSVPKKGRLHLKSAGRNTPSKGSPVFLIDRRESELVNLINDSEAAISTIPKITVSASDIKLPNIGKKRKRKQKTAVVESTVRRNPQKKIKPDDGIWVSEKTVGSIPGKYAKNCWWWLPPVVWPDSEPEIITAIEKLLKKNVVNFVLNAPYQLSLFPKDKKLNLWAGPFCNLSNSLAINCLAEKGFSGAFVSPELTKKDYLNLPEKTEIPLGIVLSANWPLAVSRIISDEIKTGIPFISPKGEASWAEKHGSDYWIFPDWKTTIDSEKQTLMKAGFTFFVHMHERVPETITIKKRPGKWNWDLKLL